MVGEALLEVEVRHSTADLPAIPQIWNEREAAVTNALADRHGYTRAWQLAEEQSGAIGHLLEDGTLSGEMLILRHRGG
jgi:hypothetical protein